MEIRQKVKMLLIFSRHLAMTKSGKLSLLFDEFRIFRLHLAGKIALQKSFGDAIEVMNNKYER
jgi:hypothetical protein